MPVLKCLNLPIYQWFNLNITLFNYLSTIQLMENENFIIIVFILVHNRKLTFWLFDFFFT